MNYWILTLSMVNIFLVTIVLFGWLTKNKNNKVEDQRLTKGLQLLQNKISILQDLSDRSDEQVKKWIHLIDQKSYEVQNQLRLADDKINETQEILQKTIDASKIFYEQSPHAEIVERQNTTKYVQAAKLAHQGYSVDEISREIDLSPAEIEIIIKLNKNQLQYAEEKLPAWADSQLMNTSENHKHTLEINEFNSQLKKMNQSLSENAFDVVRPDLSTMNQIKQEFADSLSVNSTQIPQTFIDEQTSVTKTEGGKTIRPFEFKKITLNKS